MRTKVVRFMNNHVGYDSNGCWLWLGFVRSNGYGQTCIGRGSELTHRLSYELFVGDIPDGMFVYHRCDVKRCINPDHLFVGTPKDNSQDRERKGRGNRGVLRSTQHIDCIKGEIFRMRESGFNYGEIGYLLGVSKSTVGNVLTNLWRGVRL